MPHDVDAVVTTWRRASELAHPFLSASFLDSEADNIRNVYVVHAETWVVEIESQVSGFIALIDEEIGGLFVEPKCHGQGYGRMLVDKAVAVKGDLKVQVFKNNKIGRRFYDAYGFREIDQGFHEPSGQETLLMTYRRAQ